MTSRFWARALLGLLAATGCTKIEPPALPDISSFKVEVKGLYVPGTNPRQKIPVVTKCAGVHGGQDKVPDTERGSKDCPFAIGRGEVEIDVIATALGHDNKHALTFGGVPSFRVVPGDLANNYKSRVAQASDGIANATLRASHLYGAVRVWAEDAPPQPIYTDGGILQDGLPVEPPRRSYATGLSPVIYFEEPTIAKLQQPDGFDNRSSPLIGEFLSVGKVPESGETAFQSCANDPARDGLPVQMVVTGTDPSGFYLTDITACRQVEELREGNTLVVRTPEPAPCTVPLLDGRSVTIEQWDGGGAADAGRCPIAQTVCTKSTDCKPYLPGTYGGLFVYNYSYPEGLDQGDLIWTINGAVQEFTSTTQLVFPSWTVAERVRRLPPDQWNKWLQFARPVEINARLCGGEDKFDPFLTDQLCGHNRRNLKMESLESSLVRIRNVRMPTMFENCDFNSDVSVPFFCEQTDDTNTWIWGSCAFGEVESESDRKERSCNQDCVIGVGDYAGKLCSEEATFVGFGQFVVEMNPAGPAWAGLDNSLASRTQEFDVGSTARQPQTAYPGGSELTVVCQDEVRYRFGDVGVVATETDTVLPARTVLRHRLSPTENTVSLFYPKAIGFDAGTGPKVRCGVALNSHAKINLVTKDAVPELDPDCSETDADAMAAAQCKALRAATFDVVGHLKQVQPGRPRWSVIPRDPDDVCCHPGPGLSCPRPIKTCPNP